MIRIKKLSFSYVPNKPVLKDVSFDINEGECVVLLGPNGVGKSTLISLMLGSRKAKTGEILFDDKNIKDISNKEKASYISYVPQFVQGNDLTVFDTVLLGRLPYYKIYPNKNDIEITNEYIEKFKLGELKDKQTNEISGGEKQIVSITRGFIQESKVVIFDEPTSNLDIATQLRVLNLIKEEKKNKNKGFLVSIHDINQALSIGDKFVFLLNGEIYKVCTRDEITTDIIDKVYNIKSKIVKHNEGEYIVYEN